jgi:hypothetical protein
MGWESSALWVSYALVSVFVLLVLIWSITCWKYVKTVRIGRLIRDTRVSLRRKWGLTSQEGALTEFEPPPPRDPSDPAGEGDLSVVTYPLEDVHLTILSLLWIHGALDAKSLCRLVDKTGERWHVLVMDSAQARVAAPDLKPLSYAIGELATWEQVKLSGPTMTLTQKGRDALDERGGPRVE